MQVDRVKNAERIYGWIERFAEPRRNLIKAMFDGPVGLEYFTAPASTRVEYHSAYAGGLCQHSINVVNNAVKIADVLVPGRWDFETIAFCGMFHDFGKVGDGERPYYVPTTEDWKKKRGELYDINRGCVAMPTSERGLYILQKYGVQVSSDEYLAIRLNDGQYVAENKYYANKEPDLAMVIHFADVWASRQEKVDGAVPA